MYDNQLNSITRVKSVSIVPDYIRGATFKIVLTGGGGVGKTTLVHKLITGRFLPDTKKTYIAEKPRSFTVSIYDDVDRPITISLQIYDLSGQRQYRHLVHTHLIGSTGAFFCFDLSKPNTLGEVEEWVNLLRTTCYEEIPILMVGTKRDLAPNSVSRLIQNIAKIKHEFRLFDYVTTSAKTQDVLAPFYILSRKMFFNPIRNRLTHLNT